jgi:hypothetical protein
MPTQLNILKKAAMTGDWAAMSAYADYLEEIDGDKALIIGLKFCIKHHKFPRHWKGSSHPYEWYFGNFKTKYFLPKYFNGNVPYWFSSAQIAIKAVGRLIIKINQDLKEVI